MNTPNQDTPSEIQEAAVESEAADASTPAPAAAPAPIPPTDNRRRQLRELLSIHERDRTDEQWDQIIELEIQLAPGNRMSPNEQQGGPIRHHGKPGGGQQKKHRPRPQGQGQGQGGNNRRPRSNKPGGGNPAG